MPCSFFPCVWKGLEPAVVLAELSASSDAEVHVISLAPCLACWSSAPLARPTGVCLQLVRLYSQARCSSTAGMRGLPAAVVALLLLALVTRPLAAVVGPLPLGREVGGAPAAAT
jgi:hypothetical protein